MSWSKIHSNTGIFCSNDVTKSCSLLVIVIASSDLSIHIETTSYIGKIVSTTSSNDRVPNPQRFKCYLFRNLSSTASEIIFYSCIHPIWLYTFVPFSIRSISIMHIYRKKKPPPHLSLLIHRINKKNQTNRVFAMEQFLFNGCSILLHKISQFTHQRKKREWE